MTEELITAIMQRLEVDGQYVDHVDPEDAVLIAEIRSAGRKAGRRLGWKVITGQSSQLCAQHGDHTVVTVVATEGSDELAARLDERTRLIMSHLELP